MRFSSEVRWIMPGTLPGEVLEWFHRGGGVKKEPQRTDYYLNLGGSATASLKLRDGKVEFKVMCQPAPMPLEIGDIRGLQNQWVKWSCPTAAYQPLESGCAEGGCLAVLKSRWLRYIALDGDPPAGVNGRTTGLDKGCEVELTSVRVLSIEGPSAPLAEVVWHETPQWWTLALEAYGDRQRVVDYLRLAAGLQLAPPPPCPLEQEWSDAYPAWLADQDVAAPAL